MQSNKQVLSKLQYIKIFKEKMVDFFDELLEQIPNEPSLYLLRVFINDKIPASWVLGRFMKDGLKYKKFIDARNDKIFLESDFLYGSYVKELGKNDLSKFNKFWSDESRYLSKQAKQTVWEWMDFFFKISEAYHNAYGPVEEWEFDLEEEIKNIKF